MTIDEFRNALRTLLGDACKGGLSVDEILEAADGELHPAFDLDELVDRITPENRHTEIE